MKNTNTFIPSALDFIQNDSDAIINDISQITNYNDEPKTYSYIATIKDAALNTYHNDSVASGTSFTKERALSKLFGEILERYTLTKQPQKTVYDTYVGLSKKGIPAINPDECNPYDSKQFNVINPKIKDLKNEAFHWVEGTMMGTNKTIMIPAQIVFLPFNKSADEPLLELPISTGAACGATIEDAVYRGGCEVVERDSYMLHYLLKQAGEIVKLNPQKDSALYVYENYLKRYNLELVLLNITTDLTIPSIAAIIIDKTNLGPAVSVGLKAGFDVDDTILGAIEESLMVRTWIRDKFTYVEPNFKLGKKIKEVEERAFYWFDIPVIKHLNFWLKSKKTVTPEVMKARGGKISGNTYPTLLSALEKNKIKGYYVKLSTKEMEKHNIFIVKTIIPDLQPMYLDETHPYFGKKRLFQVAKSWGKATKIEHLNHIAHPFL